MSEDTYLSGYLFRALPYSHPDTLWYLPLEIVASEFYVSGDLLVFLEFQRRVWKSGFYGFLKFSSALASSVSGSDDIPLEFSDGQVALFQVPVTSDFSIQSLSVGQN